MLRRVLFFVVCFFLFAWVGPYSWLIEQGETSLRKNDIMGASRAFSQFLSVIDSLGLCGDPRFVDVFDRLVQLSSLSGVLLDFGGKPIKKDSLFQAFVDAYKGEKYLLALFRLELYIKVFGGKKDLLPFRAYLWEMLKQYGRAEKFYKDALKFDPGDNLFYYVNYLRRRERFDEALEILEKKEKGNFNGRILNEIALVYFSYAKKEGGKGEYYLKAFDYFKRASGCESQGDQSTASKPGLGIDYVLFGPRDDGGYKFGFKIFEYEGLPVIIENLAVIALYPDGSRREIFYGDLERVVELFKTPYIATGCTISTLDSAFSVDFDISKQELETCFPFRSPRLILRLVIIDRSLKADTVTFGRWLELPSSTSYLDTLIGKLSRRAGREDTFSVSKSFSSLFSDSTVYPCFDPLLGRSYLSLWFLLESPKICEEKIYAVDSLLMIRPDEINLQLLKASFLFLCERYIEAQELFKAIVAIDPENKWAFYNLGLIAYINGDSPLALSYFKKVIDLDGAFADAYLNIGIILEESGQRLSALYYYEKYVSLGGARSKEVRGWIELIKASSF